jgi:hypothetical protein
LVSTEILKTVKEVHSKTPSNNFINSLKPLSSEADVESFGESIKVDQKKNEIVSSIFTNKFLVEVFFKLP